MRKCYLLLLFVLLLAFPLKASAQAPEETIWTTVYDQSFSGTSVPGWGEGRQEADNAEIERTIKADGYWWDVTSSSNQYAALFNPALQVSGDYQIRISAEILLPFFEPSVCAGLALGNDGSNFETFMVCNDQTYGLYQNAAGVWTPKVPFTKIQDFNQGQPVPIQLEIHNGWADIYLWDQLVDTALVSWQGQGLGFFVQPLSSQKTPVNFKSLKISLAPKTETSSALDANTPAQAARLIRMLQLKERITQSAGTYSASADLETALAQMGFYQNHSLGIAAQDFLIQSDISWESAYERPNNMDSGCGFTFRAKDNLNFLQVFVALDGNIYLNGFRNGAKVPLATYSYSQWSLKGSGTLTLAASGSKISVLYNQSLLGTITDATWLGTGDLGLTVFSGTNYDYGIRCNFKNNQLYQFVQNQ